MARALAIAALLLAAAPAAAQDWAVVFDPTLTPGAGRTTDVGDVCSTPTRELMLGSLCRPRVSHHLDHAQFPASAASNAACGFPALRSRVCFASRDMGPILREPLSARGAQPDSP
jgi:hypothetical protein